MTDATSITTADRTIRLKWHRLRRDRGDDDFTIQRLDDGIAAGASMEVDLRRTRDGDFVCLHDAMLDRETDGTGRIAATGSDEIRRRRQRSAAGLTTDRPVLFLADVIARVTAAGSAAKLQLDLKESLRDIDAGVAARFAALAGRCAERLILSGEDWAAVRALGAGVPALQLGYDPSELFDNAAAASPETMAAFVRRSVETAPDATMIYLDYRIVLRAVEVGFDIVAAIHATGARVDAWTLDTSAPDFDNRLRRLVASGVDQITTNEASALARAWRLSQAALGA